MCVKLYRFGGYHEGKVVLKELDNVTAVSYVNEQQEIPSYVGRGA